MPGLSKTNTRLLKTVNGKPHATADDHEDQILTPPASHSTRSSLSERKQQQKKLEDEENIYADPKDSSDDGGGASPPAMPAPQSGGFSAPPTGRVTDFHTGSLHTKFSKPPAPSPSSGSSSKRSFDAVDENESDDGMIFSSQLSQGSGKISKLGSGYSNIHAQPKPKSRNVVYGRKQRPQSRDEQSKGTKGFKKPPIQDKRTEQIPKFRAPPTKAGKENNAPITAFRRPAGFGEQKLPAPQTDDEGFHDLLSDSDSDSSLSLPPPSPEIEIVELDAPPHYVPTENCAICGDAVPTSLREDFEDQYAAGKALSFKRQQLFCTHHKQQTAKEVWRERAYPEEIDWNGLDLRLGRHHNFLLQLLSGEVSSTLRDEYAAKQKGRKQTVKGLQEDSSGKPQKGTSAGYYGPRGEQAIAQHLLRTFNDELRAQSRRDAAMASSGVGGGVSGYVQAVLVPEMAARLVGEDLGVEVERARGVLEESAEVGALLNSEVVGGRGKGRIGEGEVIEIA
ncbi:hypothetical protein MBLNU230_g4701t1 [Neophaeotheca triangularis]